MGQGTLAHFTKCHSVYVISYDCSDKRWGLKQVLSEVNIGQVLKFYTFTTTNDGGLHIQKR